MIGLLKFVVIIGVVLSWFMLLVNFYNSATSLIQEVYETTVSIFRNIIPPTVVDLSPLIAFVFQLAKECLRSNVRIYGLDFCQNIPFNLMTFFQTFSKMLKLHMRFQNYQSV